MCLLKLHAYPQSRELVDGLLFKGWVIKTKPGLTFDCGLLTHAMGIFLVEVEGLAGLGCTWGI